MARQRPGKRERMRAAKAERMGIIAANLSSPAPARPMFGAPRGIGSSVLSKREIQRAVHTIGFVGPRGYHTPKDTLSKREKQPGKLAGYTTTADRNRARELSAMVKGFDRETQRG